MGGVQAYAGVDALKAAGPAYGELLSATCAPVTCRLPWLTAWADSWTGWEPWVLVTDGAAMALARRRRGPVTLVVALGTGPSDETRFPCTDPAAGARLADHVARALPSRWSLRAEQLPPDCLVTAALATRLPVVEQRPGDSLPRVEVHPSRERNRHVSRNTRQADDRARRRLQDAGHDLTENWTTDPAVISRALPELADVHRRRDLALARRPDHDDARQARFYRRVVQAHEGDAELLTLRASGVLAAYVLAFRDGASFCVWDNRVNPDFQAFSAGRMANTAALSRVVADPSYDTLDWMRGEEPYKLSSATRVDPTVALRAWSGRALRLPYDAAAQGRRVRATSPLAARVFTALGKPPPREPR